VAYAPAALVQLPHALPSGQSIAAVVALGVVCTALAFLIFFALIREIGPVRATVITYVNPAVAVTLGVLLLNERLTVGIVVGFVLILSGSVLAVQPAPPRVART
jgi:drug/metabolite transporter (DMT)-like permease